VQYGMNIHVVIHGGTLKQCPLCDHYFPPDNGYVHAGREVIPRLSLVELCVPCGEEVVAQALIEEAAEV
jgi:hypothetical protein